MKKLLSVLMIAVAFLTTNNLQAEEPETNTTNSNILVAYFSATGNTKNVAEKLANVTGGDLFEIVPEQPYTSADLDWQNDQSRASVEKNDKNARPAIASNVADMGQYTTVFIGFPIWFGHEPAIIDTFVESYDFAGKTVFPFATSGSSDMGNIGADLQALIPNASVWVGQRFPADVSYEEVSEWVNSVMPQ